MTKITDYKSQPVPGTADPAANTASLAERQGEIEERIKQLEEMQRAQSEYMNEGDAARAAILIETLKSMSTAIENYEQGVPGAPGAPGTAGSAGPNWFEPGATLQDGWNGLESAKFRNPEDDPDGQAVVDGDDSLGTYMGSINRINSGDPNKPSMLAYKMTDKDAELYIKSIGGRNFLTIVDATTGDARTYSVDQGSIVIDARECKNGKIIDLRNAYFKDSDGKLSKFGAFIWGSQDSDTIYGSINDDHIAGFLGGDTIDGWFGSDKIWGDNWYKEGTFGTSEGGDDDIKGGAGRDIIYGGGGYDTVHQSDIDEKDVIREQEAVADEEVESPHEQSDIFTDTADWGWSEDVESDGTMVIENKSGKGGEISINMPGEDSVLKAEMQADGSLLLLIGGADGIMKVRIKDIAKVAGADTLADRIVKLTINGNSADNLIDLSALSKDDTKNLAISVHGNDGEHDLVLQPENEFRKDGIEVDGEILNSRGSNLNRVVGDGIFMPRRGAENDYEEHKSTYGGFTAAVSADGRQIEITKTGAVNTLDINAGEYTKVYMTEKDDGYTYIILVKPAVGRSAAETVVIKVASTAVKPDDIRVYNKLPGAGDDEDAYTLSQVKVKVISSDEDDYDMDAEDVI